MSSEKKELGQHFHLRPATSNETDLFYTGSEEQDAELGCVGHVRIDFGHRGREFWHTWWPRGEETLNTPEFKAELAALVDELRADGPLKSLDAMESYCHTHGGEITGGWTQCYGYVAETERYRFCLRCIPIQGDYNAYLTAFDLRVQALNMAPKQQFGLAEVGNQMLRDTADPSRPHTYQWFVIEHFGQEGERLHAADSLTGAIDRYNGLACDSKRLGVTKDSVATIDLIVTKSGVSHVGENWLNNPRFAGDSVISEAVTRLQLSIGGLDGLRQDMILGGM